MKSMKLCRGYIGLLPEEQEYFSIGITELLVNSFNLDIIGHDVKTAARTVECRINNPESDYGAER